jgi:hypothetical protein
MSNKDLQEELETMSSTMKQIVTPTKNIPNIQTLMKNDTFYNDETLNFIKVNYSELTKEVIVSLIEAINNDSRFGVTDMINDDIKSHKLFILNYEISATNEEYEEFKKLIENHKNLQEHNTWYDTMLNKKNTNSKTSDSVVVDLKEHLAELAKKKEETKQMLNLIEESEQTINNQAPTEFDKEFNDLQKHLDNIPNEKNELIITDDTDSFYKSYVTETINYKDLTKEQLDEVISVKLYTKNPICSFIDNNETKYEILTSKYIISLTFEDTLQFTELVYNTQTIKWFERNLDTAVRIQKEWVENYLLKVNNDFPINSKVKRKSNNKIYSVLKHEVYATYKICTHISDNEFSFIPLNDGDVYNDYEPIKEEITKELIEQVVTDNGGYIVSIEEVTEGLTFEQRLELLKEYATSLEININTLQDEKN